MTAWSQFAANRRLYARALAFHVVIGTALGWIIGPSAVGIIVLAATVAIARDIGFFIRAERGWPVTRSVIDWQRVERLLMESADLNETPRDGEPAPKGDAE